MNIKKAKGIKGLRRCSGANPQFQEQAADGKDNVWVGTTDGLARVSDGKCRFHSAELHGLADNYVQSLAADGEYLWIGTALSRFKK